MRKLLLISLVLSLLFVGAFSNNVKAFSCKDDCWNFALIGLWNCMNSGGSDTECSQRMSRDYCGCMASICGEPHLCIAD